MNDYEAKQEAKRERYEKRAELARRLADLRYKRAHEMASAIPFGQPILVGHHSEGRDRRYRAKIEANYRKSFELQERAKYYAGKAANLGKSGISSDDPEAVVKLQEKLDKLKAEQANMVALNKLIRKGDKAALAAEPFNLSPAAIEDLFKPDFVGRIGFPSYLLSNNNANIRRIEGRIAELKRNATRETKETELPGNVKIVENAEANRLQVFFPGKPDASIRTRLKSRGFRWAPSEGAWQRHLTAGAKYDAVYAITGKYETGGV